MSKRKEGRCRYKTSEGNVYDTQEVADQMASYRTQLEGRAIIAYICDVCHKYHTGGIQKMLSMNRLVGGKWVRNKKISIKRVGGRTTLRHKPKGIRPDKRTRKTAP